MPSLSPLNDYFDKISTFEDVYIFCGGHGEVVVCESKLMHVSYI